MAHRIWMVASVLLVGLVLPRLASAQGCCASGASLTPVRLDLHERALIGVQAGASLQHGSFDNSAAYRSIPSDASDVEFRQTLFGTVAPLERLQVSALVPWLETRRVAAGAPAEWGMGLGDASVMMRGEPIRLREYSDVPAVALLGSVIAPTGTSPEQATELLGADATGAGVWRLGAGVALEQVYGAFLLNLTTVVSTALPRTVESPGNNGGLRFVYAPRWDVTAALGYAVSHYWHVAGVLNFEHEGAPTIGGNRGQTRRRLETALLVTHLLDDGLRIQGGLNVTPPIEVLGRNEVARAGLTASLVRSWM